MQRGMELLLGTAQVIPHTCNFLSFQIMSLIFFLSVSWQVQELVAEYALLIKAHFSKLLNYVQQNNWRTNSNVLVGARVAIFRKTSTLMPMVITG